jgi:hypothetical protein
MIKFICIFVVFLILSVSSKSYAFFAMGNGYFSGNKGHGWFWYQTHPKKNKKKKKIFKMPSKKTLMTMPTLKFKKMLRQIRYIAISKPTSKNVYNYIVAQSVAGTRARHFAYMWKYVMAKHPSLNYMDTHVGGSSQYRNIIESQINHNKRLEIYNKLRRRMGLVLFYKPSNPYSIQEAIQLKIVANEEGFFYKKVNALNHPNMIKRMGIIKIPETIMLYKHSDSKISHYPVAIGLRTQVKIKANILYDYEAFVKHKLNYDSKY